MSFAKYFLATFTYGAIRKIVVLKSATITYHDYKTDKDTEIPVLNTEKLLLTIFGGFANISMWPYFLFSDLRSIEIYMRNDLEKIHFIDETKKKDISDYMFM